MDHSVQCRRYRVHGNLKTFQIYLYIYLFDLSVTPGFVLWNLDRGLIIYGCSVKNVGFKNVVSMKWPTNLSSRRAVVRGLAQSTLCFLHYLSKKIRVSSLSKSSGSFSFKWVSKVGIMGTLGHGGVKSISTVSSSWFFYSSDDFYFCSLVSCSVWVKSGFPSLWILILYDPLIAKTIPLIISSVTVIKSS